MTITKLFLSGIKYTFICSFFQNKTFQCWKWTKYKHFCWSNCKRYFHKTIREALHKINHECSFEVKATRDVRIRTAASINKHACSAHGRKHAITVWSPRWITPTCFPVCLLFQSVKVWLMSQNTSRGKSESEDKREKESDGSSGGWWVNKCGAGGGKTWRWEIVTSRGHTVAQRNWWMSAVTSYFYTSLNQSYQNKIIHSCLEKKKQHYY